jgi:hypothetical protein
MPLREDLKQPRSLQIALEGGLSHQLADFVSLRRRCQHLQGTRAELHRFRERTSPAGVANVLALPPAELDAADVLLAAVR